MQNFDIFEEHYWKPFEQFGLTDNFWNINSHIIVCTWLVLFILFILAISGRFALRKKNSIPEFLVLTYVKTFTNLITETLGKFYYKHVAFIISLFTFILTCNLISLIPGLEEPTTNINTTLALGLISFLYVQTSSIRANGIIGYIKEFFSPFFLFFPINVIGELAKIVSISFRLFGNIFGGSIIAKLWTKAIAGSIILEILGIMTAINFIVIGFFILFEGFIQAFVFSMLTLTYLSVVIQHEESHS